MAKGLAKVLSCLAIVWVSGVASAKPVTPEVVMDFQSLKDPVISSDGRTIAYVAQPDRGDPKGKLQRIGGNLFTVDGASKPTLSSDGQFALFEMAPDLLASENADKKEKKKLKSDYLLIDSQTGLKVRFERVKQAWFSRDGSVLVLLHHKPEASDEESDKESLGSSLTVRDLSSGRTRVISNVDQVAVAEQGFGIAYSTRSDETNGNGVFLLSPTMESLVVYTEADHQVGDLQFSEDAELLAFSWGHSEQPKRQRTHKIALYQAEEDLRWQDLNHADYFVSGFSELTFSEDKQRLFIGRQARRPKVEEPLEFADSAALKDTQQLQAKADLVLWHGDDQLIKTQEQNNFKDEFERQYLGVWHLSEDGQFIQLAGPQLEQVQIAQNKRYLLGSTNRLYRKMISWAGFYRDWYLVDMTNGKRRLLVTQGLSSDKPTLAADGSAVAWHVRGQLHWHNVRQNHTKKIAGNFANEDHDYPSPAPSYGFGPWLSDGAGVIVYDKYDAYQLKAGKLLQLTQGRDRSTIYRVVERGEQDQMHSVTKPMLLHSVNEIDRHEALLRYDFVAGLQPWQQQAARLRFVTKAEQSEQTLFRVERYDQFPDLYLTDGLSGDLKQVTFLGAQLNDLDWGSARMVDWRDNAGNPLQGVVITPPGWDGNTPLPTVIYFYRFMSQRLHQFPQMALNHRPNFPWYASEGYAIFLPDVRFEVGHPGRSTENALLSGVDRLVQLGITDRSKVGLQGHSWAGYQSAQLVTQTDAFAAVVTGAPVSNMTSAYTGIRLGSGLGRQFQYESGQSRIGKSLYQAPELYIENSPVFHADKINTPMVIMFGDRDDAVPWQQGIELYLAMRRLGKPVVMLQYQDEPHHLKKYPNKVDYSLKTMQFFNHTLKGQTAPDWWLNGQPWREPDPAE